MTHISSGSRYSATSSPNRSTSSLREVAGSLAVLFDLDGTLIDSEPIWEKANRGLASSRNAEITADLIANISGLDSTLAMRLIHERFGWVGFDIADDVAYIQAQVHEAYVRGVHWLPGARELLADVRAHGFRTGLVTSTYRALVDIVLTEVAAGCFDVVVCGDDGYAAKPDPAPYVGAATLLEIHPSLCVAVEDSPRGIASAKAAGCVVLNVSRLDRSGSANACVESLSKVTAPMLKRLALGAPTIL